jgi:hypothetical protein
MTNRDAAALTDEMLERELEQALTVEPSPEFLARVRTHIASAPTASGWSVRWPLVALGTSGALIALIVAAVVMSGLLKSRRVVAPESPAVVRTAEPPVAPRIVTPRVPETNRQPQVAVSRTARHEVRPSREPEVLIPKGEADALRRLMRGLHAGAVDPSTLVGGPRAGAVVQPVRSIMLAPLMPVAPITLEPLGWLAHQEGERQ